MLGRQRQKLQEIWYRIILIGNDSHYPKLIAISFLVLLIWGYVESQFCYMNYFFSTKLLAINSILQAHDIEGFVMFGALLGLIRSGKLMNWDYDIDLAIDATKDTEKLLSLRDKFSRLGFQVYARNEFIWHKIGGDMFQISDPILRLYTPSSPIFKYHLEFYGFHDETKITAKFVFLFSSIFL